jgi:hypothetical protein
VLEAGPLAAAAEQHALEEVRVDVVAGAPPGVQVGDLLDPVEEPLIDERLMPTGVQRPLVLEDAGVVRVGQDLRTRLITGITGPDAGTWS